LSEENMRDEELRGMFREERASEGSSVTRARLEVLSGDGKRTSEPAPAARHAVRASVRVTPNGDVHRSEGELSMFGEFVAYATRLGVVLGGELALEPFESLHAEMGDERLLVFCDGEDIVGLLMPAGAAAAELRKQLGH
jgi:hypothetical protein